MFHKLTFNSLPTWPPKDLPSGTPVIFPNTLALFSAPNSLLNSIYDGLTLVIDVEAASWFINLFICLFIGFFSDRRLLVLSQLAPLCALILIFLPLKTGSLKQIILFTVIIKCTVSVWAHFSYSSTVSASLSPVSTVEKQSSNYTWYCDMIYPVFNINTKGTLDECTCDNPTFTPSSTLAPTLEACFHLPHGNQEYMPDNP